jgi:hypothetical protein
VLIAERPVNVGAVNVTEALFDPAVAVPIVGAPGLTGPDDEITEIIDIR